MSAQDDKFIGVLGALDFADLVVDGDWAGDKLGIDVDLHPRLRPVLARGQAVEQRVMVVGDEQRGQRLTGTCTIAGAPVACHVEQAMRLARIGEQSGSAFGLEELGKLTLKSKHTTKITIPRWEL